MPQSMTKSTSQPSSSSAPTVSSPATSLRRIELDDVKKAAEFLKTTIVRTPARRAPPALETPGTDVFFKLENEQLTGSFKIRGALNKLNSLTSDERARGVVASSAGNHAQGVAYGAKMLGIQAHICMPESAPIVKVNATRSYGAEVILKGEVYDEAYACARDLEKSKGYTFVHPYEDPALIAGQGTIGLEILEEIPDLDTLVVPIGGGGLISGIATAAKAIKPSIRVIGVVSDQAPGMFHLYKNSSETSPRKRISTIAEGIAIKNPSRAMYETYISKLVDEVVSVDDNEIAQAIVFLLEKAKTVTEGAGAAGLAAVLSKNLTLGKKACVVLSGGNIDLNVMAKVIERGLRREHRLARITLVVDDLPGNLNRITTVMAENRANIIEVQHDRVSPLLGLRETRIDLLVETTSDEHIQQIHDSLKSNGFKILPN